MSIFSRLSDIVNSNLNSILDRAEDPEKIIRLVIQEMEDTLVEVRTNAAGSIAEKKELNRKRDGLRDTQAEWEQRAELALTRDREDLAKAALVEKTKLAETIALIEEELAHLDEAMAKADGDIAQLQSKLGEAKAKQKTLARRHETAGSRLKVRKTLHDGRVDDALARFEQVERKLDEAEGAVESFDLGRQKSLAQEIAELEAEAAIETELESLKARVAGSAKSASSTSSKPNE